MRLVTRKIEIEVEVSGVTVKGRNLSSTEISEIRDKNYKTVGQGGEMQTILDEQSFGRDLFIAGIVGWSDNVVDMDDKHLKCNDKNKALVYEWNQGFAQAAMNKITSEVVKIRKGEEKN